MDFIEQIVKVKKPEYNLLESLKEQYSAIAFKFGYFEAQSPCWLYVIRKDGDSAAFEVQFGNVREFKKSLELLVKSKANLCFFITSSLAHTMKLGEVKGLLFRNFEIKHQKFVLIDIETNSAVYVNFEWDKFKNNIGKEKEEESEKPLFRKPKRKKIFGKRHQHKQQD
jgi:hypothetical protein